MLHELINDVQEKRLFFCKKRVEIYHCCSIVVSGEKALARLRGLNPNHIGSITNLYK